MSSSRIPLKVVILACSLLGLYHRIYLLIGFWAGKRAGYPYSYVRNVYTRVGSSYSVPCSLFWAVLSRSTNGTVILAFPINTTYSPSRLTLLYILYDT